MAAQSLPEEVERELATDMVAFQHDPLGFVLYSFPWGEPDTELENKSGPRDWQREVLLDIGQRLQNGEITGWEAVREAIASGHGIGKSALVAWIILWAMSTMIDTKGVVTANTENQLKTKTWAELAKWHRLSINNHWFRFTATALFSSHPEHEKTWRIDMVPWSERNTEAFAGLHNEGKRVLLIFDEASAIPDLIWEVAEGALTDEDTEIVWCAFGNPTRNTGRFRECFSRFRHRWNCKQIDSRTVEGTNKRQLAAWAADYGEDSDFFRVRVRGEFPRVSDTQLFDGDDVRSAQERELTPAEYGQWPKVLSVDVARFGADESVLSLRQGPKLHWQNKFHGLRNTELAGKVRDLYGREGNVVAITVDGPGVGAGVVDILHDWGLPVVEVQPASRNSPDSSHYFNLRAWMFAECNRWLPTADIPRDSDSLYYQMIEVNYGYSDQMLLKIEKSDDLKERLGQSPDELASLVLSFAPVDTVVRPALETLVSARKRAARRKNWGAHT